MCDFDKVATAPIIIFEAVTIIGAIASLGILSKFTDRVLLRYLVVAIGVLIFELFTAPMWNNVKLGEWAYVYHDVSWILTLGWTTLILSTIILVDHFFKQKTQPVRFAIYLAVLTVIVFVAEMVVLQLGIRSYSKEVLAVLIGVNIAGVPIEGFYYIAVFTSLLIGFYKFWESVIDNRPVVPVLKTKWLRNLAIAVIAVFLFELMIEPMVVNAKMPSWSYVYRDISFLMTGLWVLLLWLAISLIDKFFMHVDLQARFFGYLAVIGVIALPLESFLINGGYRIYGPSATANFSGFLTPITNIPVEVAFAIPLYMALVIAFTRFWEITLDNAR